MTRTVRLAPLPLKTILVFGTSAVLEDERVKVREPAAVSESPIVKPMSPVDESSLTVTFGSSEMVGSVLIAE